MADIFETICNADDLYLFGVKRVFFASFALRALAPVFLVGALIKEPDYCGHSFFLKTDSKRRYFCPVCSTKRIPEKRIQVIAKGHSFQFF